MIEINIIEVTSQEQLRKIVETKKEITVYGMEYIHHKDHMHYRKSALNQVICKLANTNGITFGFDFDKWLKTKDIKALGRLAQNLRLAKKYKIKYIILSKDRNPKDLMAFASTLCEQPYI